MVEKQRFFCGRNIEVGGWEVNIPYSRFQERKVKCTHEVLTKLTPGLLSTTDSIKHIV